MLTIGSIVWGVNDEPKAIIFWTNALRYKLLRAPSKDWAILVPQEGGGPQFAITQVTSEAQQHQRHHLDLYATNQQDEVRRLMTLGVRRVDWRYKSDAD